MKKLMLFGFIVLQAFVFSANATAYLQTTSDFCYQNERIVLDRDFKIEWWIDDILVYKGTWEFDDDEGTGIDATIEDDFGREIVVHLSVTEKGRGLVSRDGLERWVVVLAIEFDDFDFVREGCH